MEEYTALKSVMEGPKRPCVYVLGGAKISDAFDMMRKVLEDGAADEILAAGVTGLVMLIAKGIEVGETTRKFLKDRGLEEFIPEATRLLNSAGLEYLLPMDLADQAGGSRGELDVPAAGRLSEDASFPDVGRKTISRFKESIARAGSIFVNGPAGMYEDPRWEEGTREIWRAIHVGQRLRESPRAS